MAVPVDLARLPPRLLNANDPGREISASWNSIQPRKRMSFNRERLLWCDLRALDASINGSITPTFVLPHKRYATFEITQHCRKVVDQNQSLRKAVANADGRPVFHAAKPKAAAKQNLSPALSHTTLWRWLTFLGAMTLSLQAGTQAFLQANPSSSFPHFEGRVHPSRARTDKRLELLSIARRLLHLQTLWEQPFLTTPFFAHFATLARPP